MYEASSIGIIGGADGPTAIFIASQFPLKTIFLGGFCAAVVLLVIVLLVVRNKK